MQYVNRVPHQGILRKTHNKTMFLCHINGKADMNGNFGSYRTRRPLPLEFAVGLGEDIARRSFSIGSTHSGQEWKDERLLFATCI